jgi:uncharacterized membrane protein YcaP (DUF421 family)
MFDLSLPWWEFIARAAMIYFALLILVRVSGKRTVGEFTPFDLVVVILLAEAAQGALSGGDESVTGSLILAATLIGLNLALAFVSARSKAIDHLVEGEPVVVMRDGRILMDALRRNNVPDSDLKEALRAKGISDHDEVRVVLLEPSGDFSVIKRKD